MMTHVLLTDSIFINSLVRRQTAGSRFANWSLSDDELISSIKANLQNQFPGYRDGVTLVKINPEGFYSSVRQLYDGDALNGEFCRRKSEEDPRKVHFVIAKKQVAGSVFVVLYNKVVLGEKNENDSSFDWEIVAVLASPTDDDAPPPMDPDTLIANHFELSGGTKTNMSNDEFVLCLRQSVIYWKDKALAEPS